VPDAGPRELVADEQLRMVLSHTRSGTLVATAFALLMAVYLHGTVPPVHVRAWVVAKVLVAVARIAAAALHARRGQPGGAAWRRLTYGLLALDGAVWGLAGWRLMSESTTLAALIGAALACVTCVATFGLQVRVAATAAYVVPILAPTAVGLLARGDDFGLIGGIGLPMLLGLQLLTARGADQRFSAGVQLRLQAQALVMEKDAALQLAHRQRAAKAQFLANISHELRTPLHGILGLARLLHVDARDPAVAHRVELIEASGTHLLGLINDLLDASRIETGRFAVREGRFELVGQAASVADIFALRARDKGLEFDFRNDFERPYWVSGDAARFRQVLHNLLGNAIKFTQRGAIRVEVTAGAAADRVDVTVSDTGPGIAAAHLATVFDAFRQLDGGADQPATGAGLGLTIAREIAQAMGGDITVRSEPGKGSTFVFSARLPAAPVAPPETGASAPDELALPPIGLRRVLVADDDDVNALIIGAYLAQLGIEHERVSDGRQAVGRALRETERPDLVLMDWRMPVLDGLAATHEIRRQEQTLGLPRVPIVALTATAADEDRQQCLAAGMDDFLAKPFTQEQLRKLLVDWGGAGACGSLTGFGGPL